MNLDKIQIDKLQPKIYSDKKIRWYYVSYVVSCLIIIAALCMLAVNVLHRNLSIIQSPYWQIYFAVFLISSICLIYSSHVICKQRKLKLKIELKKTLEGLPD